MSRDSSPKRRYLSEAEFRSHLDSFAEYDKLPSKTVKLNQTTGESRFTIPSQSDWAAYCDCHKLSPFDWQYEEGYAKPYPLFKNLVNVLLLRGYEDAALRMIQAVHIPLKKLVRGLVANGSMVVYRRATETLDPTKLEKLELKFKEYRATPVLCMELYEHLQYWKILVGQWVKESGDCEILDLVLDIWNCFDLHSLPYCQYLIDRFNEKDSTGKSIYAETFRRSARTFSRRWGYAKESRDAWGHPKAIELCTLIEN